MTLELVVFDLAGTTVEDDRETLQAAPHTHLIASVSSLGSVWPA